MNLQHSMNNRSYRIPELKGLKDTTFRVKMKIGISDMFDDIFPVKMGFEFSVSNILFQ